jgi:hypothetical protein
MDEDEEVQEVSTRSSKPLSVVHVKQETPLKVKNEFDEEQKKAARRREGNDKRYQDDPMKRYQGDSDERNREDSIKRRREAKEVRERESRKLEARRREDVSKPRSKAIDDVSIEGKVHNFTKRSQSNNLAFNCQRADAK